TVHGTATTEVVPDQMVWSLHIESKGPRLEAVANDQTKMVQKTLEFLQKSKIEPKALQTSRMQFGENWTYSSSSRVRDGYVASTDISFKTTDLERYSELWLGLAEMPAVSIRMVSFDHTKRIEFQNQTREKAILAAKEKAANSAKALGAEIGAPLLLEEDLSPSEGWQPYLQNRLANNVAVFNDQDRGAMGSLAPGTIPITIRVKAAFQLVSRGK
ncbi:MAG TPA: SIMPL domain-containing protein, partial [Clostridia bacterium]|nr:SIMPL domain-containing protein [Clostridia bacterium]